MHSSKYVSSSSSSSGIGFVGLLTIAFIVLKLTGFINWSWWWVLSPLWITPLLVIGIIALAFVGGLGFMAYKEHKKERARKAKLNETSNR